MTEMLLTIAGGPCRRWSATVRRIFRRGRTRRGAERRVRERPKRHGLVVPLHDFAAEAARPVLDHEPGGDLGRRIPRRLPVGRVRLEDVLVVLHRRHLISGECGTGTTGDRGTSPGHGGPTRSVGHTNRPAQDDECGDDEEPARRDRRPARSSARRAEVDGGLFVTRESGDTTRSPTGEWRRRLRRARRAADRDDRHDRRGNRAGRRRIRRRRAPVRPSRPHGCAVRSRARCRPRPRPRRKHALPRHRSAAGTGDRAHVPASRSGRIRTRPTG